MQQKSNKQNYEHSTIWGVVFIVVFLLVIGLSIWAALTGNYNTP